jgi:hypothetical protein
VEEANRIGDAVADDDLPVSVTRAGNPDAEPARPAAVLPFFFYAKRLSGRVSDGADIDVESRPASLRSVVFERQIANDAVPLAREPDGELLGDVERSVGLNGEERIEITDANGAVLLRARITAERADRNQECECFTNR